MLLLLFHVWFLRQNLTVQPCGWPGTHCVAEDDLELLTFLAAAVPSAVADLERLTGGPAEDRSQPGLH